MRRVFRSGSLQIEFEHETYYHCFLRIRFSKGAENLTIGLGVPNFKSLKDRCKNAFDIAENPEAGNNLALFPGYHGLNFYIKKGSFMLGYVEQSSEMSSQTAVMGLPLTLEEAQKLILWMNKTYELVRWA